MFPKKVQVHLKKPSIFRLRRVIAPQTAKLLLESRVTTKAITRAAPHNPVFGEANEIMQREIETKAVTYEKSLIWSPRFTPRHFTLYYVIPMGFIIGYVLYIHFLAQPKTMLEMKYKYHITFPNEKRLAHWLDEYIPRDRVLGIEAYTIEDLEVLYKEGLLSGGTARQQKEQKRKAILRQDMFKRDTLSKFIRKDFQKI